MNYKERYEQALRLAEDYYKANVLCKNKEENLMLEDIFPELAESEDERIRKELIKEINALWENDSALWPSSLEKKNKYIAWLEKQGEQKSAWSYEDEANLNNIIWLCNNCINGSETTWIPSQATKIKHLIETIKEKNLEQQKPADEEMKELLRTEYEKGRADAIAEMQKSSWSIEDESICNNIIYDIANDKSICKYEVSKRICDEQITWLKSLKQRIGG